MHLSQFFLPLLKETPSEAQIASHRLMLRAGMVRQLCAGIYNWLPLGFRVLKRIEHIVREEMDAAGVQEMLMPTIQPAELWKESERYDAYGKEMLRITDRSERELLYGPTNEEVMTAVFRDAIKSYKSLPVRLYHIQWKFRDEIRPRFGVMRGREFLMKDAYSFDLDAERAKESYYLFYRAYLRIFARMGLRAIPVRAATGPIGGDLSHEFHIVADTGESELFYDTRFDALYDQHTDVSIEDLQALYAATDEIHDPNTCPLRTEQLQHTRGIEVGHIFNFGTKYSEPMHATVTGGEGREIAANMGSYGIGVSRLVGAIIEANHDSDGIIWPQPVAPFAAGIINLRVGDEACDALSKRMYHALQSTGRDVLYDDTSERAGAKFAGMDLIGLPWQITVGPRGAAQQEVELKCRRTGEKHTLSYESALQRLLENA